MNQSNKGILNDTVEADSQFKQITYNGIALIEHVSTKYINISKAFRDNGKRWYKYKQTQQWKEIEKVAENKFKTGCWKVGANSPPPQNGIYFDVDTGKNEFRGIYIHPKLVHFVCQYVSVDYAFKVAELMDSINDQVHSTMEKQHLPDTPTNAQPIFEQTIEQHRFVSDVENSQCWGVREHDKYDYLDSWDKDYIKQIWSSFKQSLKTKLDLTLDELKRDYPQLLN